MVFWRTLREMFTQKMNKTPKTNKYKYGMSRAKVIKKRKTLLVTNVLKTNRLAV